MPYKIESKYKGELAREYGVSSETFRRWCKLAGLDFGHRKMLNPQQVQTVIDKLGPPTMQIS